MTTIVDGTLGVSFPVGATQSTGAGPAFSAYLGTSQSVSSATFTKVQLNTKIFDTANCFDAVTNYRFTPTVAGYYQINAALFALGSGLNEVIVAVYKNGSIYSRGTDAQGSLTNPNIVYSEIIQMNGTTDYLEMWGLITGTASFGYSSPSFACRMSGALIRGA